jgi:hypothetical protein
MKVQIGSMDPFAKQTAVDMGIRPPRRKLSDFEIALVRKAKSALRQAEESGNEINRLRMELQQALLQEPPQTETDVLAAAEDFVQKWIMHPRDPELVGPAHAELIRTVLNHRKAIKDEAR